MDENNPKLTPCFKFKFTVSLVAAGGRKPLKRPSTKVLFGGCAHFDFMLADSVTYSVFSDVLPHRLVHLSFQSTDDELSQQQPCDQTMPVCQRSIYIQLEYKERPGLTHCHGLFLLRRAFFKYCGCSHVFVGRGKCRTMCYWFHNNRRGQLMTLYWSEWQLVTYKLHTIHPSSVISVTSVTTNQTP